MKNICFALAHHFSERKGGAELQADLISKSLLDFRINYLRFGFSNNSKPLVDDNVNIFSIKEPKFNIRFLNNFNTKFTYKLLDELNSDAYYQRGFSHSDVILKYARQNGKKFILGISMDSQCRPPNHKTKMKYLKNFLDDRINVNVLKNADVVIAQTKHQQKLLLENYSVKSMVIPNAHQIPIDTRKKFDFPIVCWIANLKKWKRPDIFLKLAQHLSHVPSHFYFAGRNDGSNFAKKIIKKANQLTNVTYLGELPFHKTNELLEKSHIFVNTSEPNEGFPNTFIQSWMRETPVISLEFDPDNLLKEEKLGFCSNNFETLVSQIEYLIKNGKESSLIGRKSRSFANENYNLETISKLYAELFS